MRENIDRIRIESLELSAHIGITEGERATPQRLTLRLVLEPTVPFADAHDDIARTVDYAAVCETAQMITAQRPRQLLETLAEEIADALFTRFGIRTLQLELRKYVVPNTAFVSVEIERRSGPA